AQAREVELMEQGRIERDQLLALEANDHVTGRGREVDRSELLRDLVQPSERAAVVVLVVAFNQLLRQVRQEPGTAVYGCELVTHRSLHERHALKEKEAPPTLDRAGLPISRLKIPSRALSARRSLSTPSGRRS